MAELVVYNHFQITLVHVPLGGKVLIAKNKITAQIILVEATADVFPPDMLTVANAMKVLMVPTVKLTKMNVINGTFAKIMVNVLIPTDRTSVYVNKIILGGIVKRDFTLVIQPHAKIMENVTPLMIIIFNVLVLKDLLENDVK